MATGLVEDSGSIIHMLVTGPRDVLFGIMFDMVDHVPVLLFQKWVKGGDTVFIIELMACGPAGGPTSVTTGHL
jgi:hypothetical protein